MSLGKRKRATVLADRGALCVGSGALTLGSAVVWAGAAPLAEFLHRPELGRGFVLHVSSVP
ncbi:hypothetical protein SEA_PAULODIABOLI_382 [Microbacterium phage PauloDiaboli]|nr:hypothetical protein SEA_PAULODIABOLI_27 [Microbacterium phage PauloDiaboli]QIG58090.1 hypothetical protein SEA_PAULODIABOLI_382 [Microbacterium phage PauloDiaboli]